MTRLLAAVLVVAAALACAPTKVEMRRDDAWLTRVLPTRHTIMPTHPSTTTPQTAPGNAFATERVSIDEPTFDEPHSLKWQHDVAAYSADVLNRSAPTVDAPVATKVTFKETFDRRDFPSVATMHIELESTLANGDIVRSDEVKDLAFFVDTDSTFAFMGMTGLELLLAAGGFDVAALVQGPAKLLASPFLLYATMGLIGASIAVMVASFAYEAYVALGDQERWSELYLKALLAHAGDVQRASRRKVLITP